MSKFFRLALTASALLAGCGGGSNNTVVNSGGGGATPSVGISTANQSAVAGEVVTNALSYTANLMAVSDVPVSVQSVAQTGQPAFNLRTLLDDLVQQLQQTAVPVAPSSVLVVQSAQACSGGGTVQATFDDSNGNKKWDTGESATLVFTGCIENGFTLNGTLTAKLNALTLTTQDMTLQFSNLTATQSGVTVQVSSGTVAVLYTQQGINLSSSRYRISNMQVAVSKYQGNLPAFAENFVLNEDLTIAENATAQPVVDTISGNGSITTNNTAIAGTVLFNITTPIIKNEGQSLATQGAMTITGSNGSELYLSFATPNSGSVTLLLKKDGVAVGTPQVVSVAALFSE